MNLYLRGGGGATGWFALFREATSRSLMRHVEVTGRFEQLVHAVFAALDTEFPEDCAGELGPVPIRVWYLPLVRGFNCEFVKPLLNDVFLGFVLSI